MTKKKRFLPKNDLKNLDFSKRFVKMFEQFDFSQLASWKAACIIVAIAKVMRTQFGDMKNQLERAALSIGMNIAEASGRFPRGGSNVPSMFSHSRGSNAETANVAFQTALIHASTLKHQDKEIILFALGLCAKAALEIERLINENSLISRPKEIGIFAEEEVRVLDHIIMEMSLGKNIYGIISEMVESGQKTEEAMPDQPIVEKFPCAHCKKSCVKEGGDDINVKMALGKVEYFLPAFFCKPCQGVHGKPDAIVKGKVQWTKTKTNPLFSVEVGHLLEQVSKKN